MLQCVAVCCSVLQCVVLFSSCCSDSISAVIGSVCVTLQSIVECSSVLHYVVVVAVCCSVLQSIAVCCSVMQCAAVRCSVLQSIAVYDLCHWICMCDVA